MKERPILFSTPMVRAILDGTKTQTRRVVKPQPKMVTNKSIVPWDGPPGALKIALGQLGRGCPYGQPGDRLWVREKFRALDCGEIDYFADGEKVWGRMQDRIKLPDAAKWKPSIHMPRWASRITLEITGVRVERLQYIGEADALEEGITYNDLPNNGLDPRRARTWYRRLWESINGTDSWTANPWVWVVEFKRLEQTA